MIVRVFHQPTLVKYQGFLTTSIPKYIKKSGSEYSADDINNYFKLTCNSPYHFNAVVTDGDDPMGFFTSWLQVHYTRRLGMVEHFYVPKASIAADVWNSIITWMKEKWELPTENIQWFTRRDVDAFIRLAKKHGVDLQVKSYILGVGNG